MLKLMVLAVSFKAIPNKSFNRDKTCGRFASFKLSSPFLLDNRALRVL